MPLAYGKKAMKKAAAAEAKRAQEAQRQAQEAERARAQEAQRAVLARFGTGIAAAFLHAKRLLADLDLVVDDFAEERFAIHDAV